MKLRKDRLAKTLKPRPKSRFLPGEVNSAVNAADLTAYIDHRIHVTYAAKKIDNEPPILIPETYFKLPKISLDAQRTRDIDRENLELLKQLNIIHRSGISRSRVIMSTASDIEKKTLPKYLYSSSKIDNWNLNRRYKSNCAEKRAANELIMRENKILLKHINAVESSFDTEKLLREWKQVEAKLEHVSKYPLYWKDPRFIEIRKPNEVSISKDSSPAGAESILRPRCYFDVELAGTKQKLGRIVIELYADVAPKTCANFESFCRGFNGLSYENTPFHRILLGYWCQGGDVTNFNGTGGTSIYGDKFEDENFKLQHTGPGVLSMYSNDENSNDSKFNITFKSLPTMDGKRVVFGKIIRGLSNIYKIEGFGSKSGKPRNKVIISKCGVIPLKKDRSPREASSKNQDTRGRRRNTIGNI